MSDAFVVYVRHGEKVLILQRSDEVADFPGAWDGVYGVGGKMSPSSASAT